MINKNDELKPKRMEVSSNNWKRRWYKFKSLSFIKHIFIFYLLITLIGSLLLWWDASQTSSHIVAKGRIGYDDALFTAASAFSDTGLSPLTAATTFSAFGQAIIAILILVGGLGWFALKVYFFNIMFGKPMSIADRDALAAERGSANLGVTRDLIKIAVTILFVIIAIASICLALYFYYNPIPDVDRYTILHNNNVISNFGDSTHTYGPINHNVLETIKKDQANFVPTGNWDVSIKYGIFHAISAINNAGFDIIGGQSIVGYYHSYGLQIMFIILFVLGGVGYPVIYDTWKKTTGIFTGKKHKFSFFSKISMVTYTIITMLGLIVIFSIELTANNHERVIDKLSSKFTGHKEVFESFWNNSNYGSHGDKTMALFFNTMSTRNAGFSTINIGTLSQGSMIVYIILMFIGSAPSSTAGGVRTTTVAVIILGLWSRVKGKSSVRAFNRRIPTDTVKNAYVVFTTALMIVILASLIVMTSLSTHGGSLNQVVPAVDNAGQPIVDQSGQQLFTETINDVTGERYNFTEIVFEVGSAFGTTGLSAGVTPYLSLASKMALIFVMFIGQLGVSSSILVWTRKNPKSKHFNYIKEDISIG